MSIGENPSERGSTPSKSQTEPLGGAAARLCYTEPCNYPYVDANTLAVLIALISVGGAFLTAAWVTSRSGDASRRVERDRWKRDLYAPVEGIDGGWIV
jgi:hypothetical protein